MSALDLHPEELLDKAVLGTLTDGERAWLGQHLEKCSVCRFEQQARLDFAAAAAPSAELNVDGLVARALAGLPTEQAAPRTARRSISWVAAAAVAMFAVASFAAVGQVTGILPKLVEKMLGPAPPQNPSLSPEGGEGRGEGPRKEIVPEAEPEALAAPVEEEAPPPVPQKRLVSPSRPLTPALSPLRGEGDAAAVFSQGNSARIRGDRAEAALRYRELLEKFPASPEARLTRATLGRMLLDSGDVRGALSELDLYLASGDEALREEAMAARARALALLARPGDEAAAWQALLDSYPDSIHAERALDRLRALGAR